MEEIDLQLGIDSIGKQRLLKKRRAQSESERRELDLIDKQYRDQERLGCYFERARELGLFSSVSYGRLIYDIHSRFKIKICFFGNTTTINGKPVKYTRDELTESGADYVCLREGFKGLQDRVETYVRTR
jgi:hypothetical protein